MIELYDADGVLIDFQGNPWTLSADAKRYQYIKSKAQSFEIRPGVWAMLFTSGEMKGESLDDAITKAHLKSLEGKL